MKEGGGQRGLFSPTAITKTFGGKGKKGRKYL